MKKILLLIGLILVFTIGVNAQVGSGELYTFDADTVSAADDNADFDIPNVFRNNVDYIIITAKCTQLGGTSDGTMTVYGSLDGTNYSFLNFVGSGNALLGVASPKASITGADLNQITITDGLQASWVVYKAPFKYYRLRATGTDNDETKVEVNFMWK